MDEPIQTNGNFPWTQIGWSLGLAALAGGAYTYWERRAATKRRRFSAAVPDVDLAKQSRRLGRDVGRAGRAAARGVNAGAAAAWDVAVGGAEAVRSRAKVLPDIADSVGEAGASFGSAAGSAAANAGGAARSFAGATTRTIMWLTLLGTALLYIYMPDPNQRDRFFARGRRYFNGARNLMSDSTRRTSRNFGENPAA